jgi:hypothetical protein
MGLQIRLQRAIPIVFGIVLLALVGGCRSALGPATVYQYFSKPALDDAWSRKIHGWQDRERIVAPGPASVAGSGAQTVRSPASVGDLRAKYVEFRSERRRAMARELAEWIQGQARDHYIPDGPVDHWATLEETFRNNGDDCDGLELLSYNLLRELGFDPDEVYRAIVVRRSDGQHHMVTLWFEDRDDPWVIDPTGAMTFGMPHISDVPEWVPLKLFSEDRDWTVVDQSLALTLRK